MFLSEICELFRPLNIQIYKHFAICVRGGCRRSVDSVGFCVCVCVRIKLRVQEGGPVDRIRVRVQLETGDSGVDRVYVVSLRERELYCSLFDQFSNTDTWQWILFSCFCLFCFVS
jgi:hypothetical protein